ncbi:NAD-dependent epimerase/dehydratase family protein [Actinoplanes sp. NPDC026619]|uniref:NAD-dependent epimerase/dehydratase family protein n=1 Tax=Actinoplanes sp. NPDC026619 TaxID=3155798 RepID=UPI0033E6D1E3
MGAGRALVTGGAGFVGSHLVQRLLADGLRVGILDDMSSGTGGNLDEARRVGLRTGDVLVADVAGPDGAEAIARWHPDVVFHLAAQARVTDSVARPYEGARVNVLGTVNVMTAAAAAQVTSVVVASSGGTVYGEPPPGPRGIAETAPRRPVSPYGASKAAADLYLDVLERTLGVPVTVLLLGNVYGPRLDGELGRDVVSCCVRDVLHGRPPAVCGDGTQTRDFVHVTDVAAAFARARTRGAGARLNIGSGVETSVNELVGLVCAAAGVPPGKRPVPPRPAEVGRVCLDVSAAARVLGWRPTVPLSEGIARLADRTTAPAPVAGAAFHHATGG